LRFTAAIGVSVRPHFVNPSAGVQMALLPLQLGEITKLENERHKRLSQAITRKEQESVTYLRELSAIAIEKEEAIKSVLLFAAATRRQSKTVEGTTSFTGDVDDQDSEIATLTANRRASLLPIKGGEDGLKDGQSAEQFGSHRRRSSVVGSTLHGDNSISAHERVQIKLDQYREVSDRTDPSWLPPAKAFLHVPPPTELGSTGATEHSCARHPPKSTQAKPRYRRPAD
jgi:hypothetical protein